jgi:hypothetical protein
VYPGLVKILYLVFRRSILLYQFPKNTKPIIDNIERCIGCSEKPNENEQAYFITLEGVVEIERALLCESCYKEAKRYGVKFT